MAEERGFVFFNKEEFEKATAVIEFNSGILFYGWESIQLCVLRIILLCMCWVFFYHCVGNSMKIWHEGHNCEPLIFYVVVKLFFIFLIYLCEYVTNPSKHWMTFPNRIMLLNLMMYVGAISMFVHQPGFVQWFFS